MKPTINHTIIESKQQVLLSQTTPVNLKKILISVCIALMAVIASVSGLNVAQPMLALEFDISQSTVLWIINIYALTLAALLLPLSAVGDRLGRKKMLLMGLVIFGAASMLSAIATNVAIMLLARLMTGIGAALIMPITLAVITSTFPSEERSKAIGIWTGVAGGGGILGMYLSALLVDVASWRWLFLLPVVLGVISIIMTIRFIPDSIEKSEHRFDIVGSLLSVIAIAFLVYGLHEAPGLGWTAPLVLSSLFIGILAVIGFIIWELGYQGALLDVRLFGKRNLSGGSITLLTVFGVQAGIFIVLFPFFQGVLGWSGLRSTIGMMPMAVLMMLSSALAPKLVLKVGSRYTIAFGIALGAIGALLMGQLVSVEGGYVSILPGMLVMGLGMGFSMTPSTEAITSSLPADRQGVASALNDITRELGTALGVALLGPLVSAQYRVAIGEKLSGFPKELITRVKEGLAHAQAVAPSTGTKAEIVIRIARESFVSGWQQAMWIGVGFMSALFIYILIKGPEKNKEATHYTTVPSITNENGF
ncbi:MULTISPECIES: MFS transporter [Xanthocytophaga]|uniref:MFS transporter n=1 Tax=Xanthocytophaga agilis TaxID=3048010 RepID=A0AAE3RBU6_9BACT|nr:MULTISPECIES: MFS transporter [Xanthocytophaga]MDJ1470695.1 MFS transporter [Xanthocytophaga flavus]MDJ1505279.1 MFS transporter [Xanthocytophaga agilis]